MKLIVGLGNPGDSYINTRHNLGFTVLEKMVSEGWSEDKKFKAQTFKLDKDLLLVKPQSFMNNSGMSVAAIVKFFKIKPEDVIIIHDDLDLKLGKIKVRIGGSAAGHHGVESIISVLGTDKFIRIRLGIGNLQTHLGEHKRNSFNADKFVVDSFLPNEKSTVKRMIKTAILALETLLEKGLEETQKQYH